MWRGRVTFLKDGSFFYVAGEGVALHDSILVDKGFLNIGI